jgi:hypothetical protein
MWPLNSKEAKITWYADTLVAGNFGPDPINNISPPPYYVGPNFVSDKTFGMEDRPRMSDDQVNKLNPSYTKEFYAYLMHGSVVMYAIHWKTVTTYNPGEAETVENVILSEGPVAKLPEMLQSDTLYGGAINMGTKEKPDYIMTTYPNPAKKGELTMTTSFGLLFLALLLRISGFEFDSTTKCLIKDSNFRVQLTSARPTSPRADYSVSIDKQGIEWGNDFSDSVRSWVHEHPGTLLLNLSNKNNGSVHIFFAAAENSPLSIYYLSRSIMRFHRANPAGVNTTILLVK